MSFFKGANNLEPNVRYPYFPSGFQGQLKVLRTTHIETREKGNAYISEFEVVSSNLTDEACLNDPATKDNYVPIGSKRAWYQPLKAKDDTGNKACISFLYACLGYNPADPKDKETIDAKIKPHQEDLLNETVYKNTLHGKIVSLETSTTTLKKSGNDFTVHHFSPAT